MLKSIKTTGHMKPAGLSDQSLQFRTLEIGLRLDSKWCFIQINTTYFISFLSVVLCVCQFDNEKTIAAIWENNIRVKFHCTTHFLSQECNYFCKQENFTRIEHFIANSQMQLVYPSLLFYRTICSFWPFHFACCKLIVGYVFEQFSLRFSSHWIFYKKRILFVQNEKNNGPITTRLLLNN